MNLTLPRFALSHPGLRAPMILLAIALQGPLSLWPADPEPALNLLHFDADFDTSRMTVSDAKASLASSAAGQVLRVNTGHSQRWPGVTLKAPAEMWNLSAFDELALDLSNPGARPVTVSCRVDNTGANGTDHCVTGSLTVEPGRSGTLAVRLRRAADSTLDGKLFGMRGYPVAKGGPGTIDPAKITQLLVFVSDPKVDYAFDLHKVRARGSYVPPTAWISDADPFFPFIDTFGQYKHKDWPGKVRSVADLQARRASEAKELDSHSGPADWNQYGGWAAGPQLKASGFFRTEKVQGKWWLIDPDGRLFFSQGIDCVRMRDVTPIEEREAWFEEFPGLQPEFQPFIAERANTLKGHYAGRSPRCFNFAGANLMRKYGTDAGKGYLEVIHRRLRSWGLNTIGMWSDQSTFLMRRTPYVDSIGSHGVRMIEGSEGYWGKFPDVWDPAFKARLREGMAAKVNRSANDRWCIGYFADNEMSWGDETSLALAALKSPANQVAKSALIDGLKEKHGTIDKLNDSWGTAHASWEAMLDSTSTPDPAKARPDLVHFYTRTAETYFRTVREVIKERAPNQLYLGCRFAWVNPLAAAAAAKYCDIVSYNLYYRSVADFQFNGGADVPLIIGEFHFGALDRGLFHTGLVPVRDQAARAQAYRDYVEGALRHPSFVGCHWFQYQDEPATGRVLDEENYQIGFVDVADTPYREIVDACRQVAAKMYPLRLSGR